MDITFVTSAPDDEQGYFLLKELGMPFRTERRIGQLADGQDLSDRESQAQEAQVQVARHSRAVGSVGVPRAVYRKFGICRICLRERALLGEIPGMRKASW